MILGSFVYAVAVEIFLSPLKISPGGITGIAAAINYATKFPTGTLILIINIPIILFALVKFGKVFIVTDQNRYDFVEFSEPKEIEFFKENNYEMVSISNLIYRAETAAISALAGVVYEYEL